MSSFTTCILFSLYLFWYSFGVFLTTAIEFLGITVAGEFCLPSDKIYKLMQLILSFIRRKKGTLKEIKLLLGQLAFAAWVLPIGRVFSKRLYSSISRLKNPAAHIRLSSDIKEACWFG